MGDDQVVGLARRAPKVGLPVGDHRQRVQEGAGRDRVEQVLARDGHEALAPPASPGGPGRVGFEAAPAGVDHEGLRLPRAQQHGRPGPSVVSQVEDALGRAQSEGAGEVDLDPVEQHYVDGPVAPLGGLAFRHAHGELIRAPLQGLGGEPVDLDDELLLAVPLAEPDRGLVEADLDPVVRHVRVGLPSGSRPSPQRDTDGDRPSGRLSESAQVDLVPEGLGVEVGEPGPVPGLGALDAGTPLETDAQRLLLQVPAGEEDVGLDFGPLWRRAGRGYVHADASPASHLQAVDVRSGVLVVVGAVALQPLDHDLQVVSRPRSDRRRRRPRGSGRPARDGSGRAGGCPHGRCRGPPPGARRSRSGRHRARTRAP